MIMRSCWTLWLVVFVIHDEINVRFTSPIPKAAKIPRAAKTVDYNLLSDCENNLQSQCIEQYGTEEYLLPGQNKSCNIEKVYDCLKNETKKDACVVRDPGTVAYVNAFLHDWKQKYIKPKRCADEHGKTEVEELFKLPAFYDILEPKMERTHGSSGAGWVYDDSEQEEADQSRGEDGSGSGSGVITNSKS